ncbi:MAG: SDR family NAD(P)-dependent oxidoreductase [Acidibacillus sp.]|nr:SDR family NAD(P)-dependent oxidoreductase [Acidibacillus sp.]
MKTIVITGSTKGLGFALATSFLEAGHRVIISGKNQHLLDQAMQNLAFHQHRVSAKLCDVRNHQDIVNLWDFATTTWGEVDIWINNAGINQQGAALWELSFDDIERVIQTNLQGMIYGTKVALQGMLQQSHGQIYNVDGFGSDGMQRRGINLYGTTKRALTHFTTACAKEASHTPIQVGLLCPGMMITDLLRDETGHIRNERQTKRIFNILGDRPATVAKFFVPHILHNKKNGAHIVWLTKRKILWRFARSSFHQRDLFED